LETSDGYNKVSASYTITIIYNEKLVFIPKSGSTLTILEGESDSIRAVDPTGLAVKIEFDITTFRPLMPSCSFVRGSTI
jgi:hypothetical protein